MRQKIEEKIFWGNAKGNAKKIIQKIIRSKPFLAIVMFTIGASWTVVYYEVKNLEKLLGGPIFGSRTIFVVNETAQASEGASQLIENRDEVVETKTEAEVADEGDSYQVAIIKRISKEEGIDKIQSGT